MQDAAGSKLDLATHDAVLSGWFQEGTNELFRGMAIRPTDRVVDLGCGDGRNILFCAKRGAHITAIDIDPEVISAARSQLAAVTSPHRYTTHVSNANPLPLDDGYASRIICTEVLEHVDDPDQVLAELARIGEPGALYLLSVPGDLQEHLQEHVAPPTYFQKPNHIRIIGREQFAEMVTHAGLVIQEQTQFGFFWSIWMALFWHCKVDLHDARHPVIEHWAAAWQAVLDMPDGAQLKQQLDKFMPKSQVIIARKP